MKGTYQLLSVSPEKVTCVPLPLDPQTLLHFGLKRVIPMFGARWGYFHNSGMGSSFPESQGPLNDASSYEASFFSLTNSSFEALGLLLGSESLSNIGLLLPVKSRTPLTTLYIGATATSLLKHRVLGLPVFASLVCMSSRICTWEFHSWWNLVEYLLVLESSWRLQFSLRRQTLADTIVQFSLWPKSVLTQLTHLQPIESTSKCGTLLL